MQQELTYKLIILYVVLVLVAIVWEVSVYYLIKKINNKKGDK